MRILITGCKGMLAKAVIDRFKEKNELILTDVEELDITQKEKVDNSIEKVKPNIIINCAAYTAVDNAENNFELAEKINALGVKNLAEAAERNKSILVHISTDYVFDGKLKTDKAYKETDKTNPTTAYGITKLHGEEAVIKNCSKYYIFRTAWLYGDGNNFVRTMIRLGQEKEEINVVNDQYGSPTYTVDLANIIYSAIKNKIPYGIYHSTNEGFITWYDFAKKILDIAKISCKLTAVSSEEFITLAKRPKNSKLSKEKLKDKGIKIPNWENALERYLEEYL